MMRSSAFVMMAAGLLWSEAVHAEPPPAPAADAASPSPEGGPGAKPTNANDSKTGVFPLLTNVRIFPLVQGEAAFNAYAGPGVSDYQLVNGTGLHPGVSLALARIGLAAFYRERAMMVIRANLLGVSNSLIAPRVDEQQRTSAAAVADVFVIGYRFFDFLHLSTGVLRPAFGLENQVDFRDLAFQQRSLATTAIGNSSSVDLGIYANGNNDKFSYSVAYVNGDGLRPNMDDGGDVSARVAVRPWGIPTRDTSSGAFKLQLGLSGRYGTRDSNTVWYAANDMVTPGGYAYWQASYVSGITNVRIIPSSTQSAAAVDASLFWGPLDLVGELIVNHDERREADARQPDVTLRAGTLSGYAYQATLSMWAFGPRRVTQAGVKAFVDRLVEPKPDDTQHALQLVARWAQIKEEYDSVGRSHAPDGRLLPGVSVGGLDSDTKNLDVQNIQVGANYWLGPSIKLLTQAAVYVFPGAQLGEGKPSENQAIAPGAVPRGNNGTKTPVLPPGVTNTKSFFPPPALGARTYYELSAAVLFWL
jgi:hypothetical protein